MIISLTGFMGCGKSSVGRRLSQLLCCPFMDLDQVIEERAGRSIPEIFASEGEEAFRSMELDALRNIVSGWEGFPKQSLPSQAMGPSLCGQRGSTVSETPPNLHHAEVNHQVIAMCNATCQSADYERPSLVLALGGGAVMRIECAEIVHSDTLCIYLKASVETLMEHLSGQTDGRPMLGDSDLRTRIEELMALRSETYEKTAHIVIDTDGKSIEAVASEIISKLA
jgi:shikimate kinase